MLARKCMGEQCHSRKADYFRRLNVEQKFLDRHGMSKMTMDLVELLNISNKYFLKIFLKFDFIH